MVRHSEKQRGSLDGLASSYSMHPRPSQTCWRQQVSCGQPIHPFHFLPFISVPGWYAFSLTQHCFCYFTLVLVDLTLWLEETRDVGTCVMQPWSSHLVMPISVRDYSLVQLCIVPLERGCVSTGNFISVIEQCEWPYTRSVLGFSVVIVFFPKVYWLTSHVVHLIDNTLSLGLLLFKLHTKLLCCMRAPVHQMPSMPAEIKVFDFWCTSCRWCHSTYILYV